MGSNEVLSPFDSQESAYQYVESVVGDVYGEQREEAIYNLSEILASRLKSLGLQNSESIALQDIEHLVDEGYGDIEDIENLYFHVWDEARSKLGPFTRIKFSFLLERADLTDPDELERSQNDDALITLSSLQVDLDHGIHTDAHRTARRRLGWLFAKEPALGSLKEWVDETTKKSGRLNSFIVAEKAVELLRETKKAVGQMDETKMNHVDLLWKKAEEQRLSYILAIAESVRENLQQESPV